VALVGVPWDEESSFLRGAAAAPARIREALASPATNWFTEDGLDLESEPRLADVGDVDLATPGGAAEAIERALDSILATGARALALGGDHAVTHPLVRAQRRAHGALEILHLDAHPDLYDEFAGSRASHACPFARILEEGLARRLVQVGVRTLTAHQRAQARRFGVEVIEMRHFRRGGLPRLAGPVYLSLDLDALDPAFAPGVSHPEPGGLATREVLEIIQTLDGPLVGVDLVELNPRLDPQGLTARVAAKCVKEIAGRMLRV
jgi:agmatinase